MSTTYILLLPIQNFQCPEPPYLVISLFVTELEPGRMEASIGLGDGKFGGPMHGLVGTELGIHGSLKDIEGAAMKAVAAWRENFEIVGDKPDKPYQSIPCEVIAEGPGPNESIVRVRKIDSTWEEIVVPKQCIVNLMMGGVSSSFLKVHVIRFSDGKVLVELPRESAAGHWRLWWAPENMADTAPNRQPPR